MEYFITGDLHGKFDRIAKFHQTMIYGNRKNPNNIGIICLGDVGLNYYLNKTDEKNKKKLCDYGFTYYCLRGNHELPPARLPGIAIAWDENVKGYVYMEKKFPNIKYLVDGEVYYFNSYKTLAIGGAYSVDKYYRLNRAGVSIDAPYETKAAAGWFEDEQLSKDIQQAILEKHAGESFSMILSHTCPISLEPRDLFLNGIDQSQVDKSMEYFLEEVKEKIIYEYWFFGHYHADRIEAPFTEMFYTDLVALNDVFEYWEEYALTGELPWYLTTSPNFCK